jgi:DNA polymerase-3 subunit chi
MTRIDFHFNAPNKLAYTCRLVRKAHGAGNRLVIFGRDRKLLAELDEQLWTFASLEFLPHCFAGDTLANETPILLADTDTVTAHHDVLVNLDLERPEFFSRFERVIEVVTPQEADRRAARERWKFYKERGYPLTSFDIAGARP